MRRSAGATAIGHLLALALAHAGAPGCSGPVGPPTSTALPPTDAQPPPPKTAPPSVQARPTEPLAPDPEIPEPSPVDDVESATLPAADDTDDDTDDNPSPPPAPKRPRGEVLLYDFSEDYGPKIFKRPSRDEFDRLLERFPHPHAPAGAHCDPNYPGTPPEERSGGTLLPIITQVQGSFTAPDRTELAVLIDYCPTGAGVPRTRRLLVFEGDTVTLDHEFGKRAKPEKILHAVDVDGDGRDEILFTRSNYDYEQDKVIVRALLVRLAPGSPKTLGRWIALEHCSLDDDTMAARRIVYRRKGSKVSFRAKVIEERCVYPP